MKLTQIHVLRHFLSEHEANTQFNSEVSPYFQNFFTQSELHKIVLHIYGESTYDGLNIRNATKQELLEYIGDDQAILSYYLSLWDEERKNTETQNGYGLSEILAQLQLEGHYLLHKPIDQWDEFDKSNFRNLQSKAGVIQSAYGIYSDSVMPHELSMATPPQRFYETRSLAEEALLEHCGNTTNPDDYMIHQVVKST